MFGPADGMIKLGKNQSRISGLAPDTRSRGPIKTQLMTPWILRGYRDYQHSHLQENEHMKPEVPT